MFRDPCDVVCVQEIDDAELQNLREEVTNSCRKLKNLDVDKTHIYVACVMRLSVLPLSFLVINI